VAQSTTNMLLEKPSAVNISIPAVREAVFIAELNTNESFSKAAIVTSGYCTPCSTFYTIYTTENESYLHITKREAAPMAWAIVAWHEKKVVSSVGL
jgi:hypothetical protein